MIKINIYGRSCVGLGCFDDGGRGGGDDGSSGGGISCQGRENT